MPDDDDLPRQRALLLRVLGPAIFMLGFSWAVVRLVLTDPLLTMRAIAFAPPHQMMVVGLLVAAVCLPLAAEVRGARADELALPQPEQEQEERSPRERRRRSYHGYN